MRLHLLTGVMSLAVSHGVGVVEAEGPPAAKDEKPTLEQAVSVTGDFAFDLYRQLAKANPGTNLFLSPYSVSSALTMAAEGARGKTAAEMGDVLGYPEAARQLGAEARLLPWNMAMIHQEMAKYHTLFQSKRDSPYLISVANALYGEKTYPFSPSFVDTMKKFYGGDVVRLVDFKNAAEASRQQMNAWVEQQTRERIKNLVPAREVDALTRLVIINAIYFKGDWAAPFKDRTVQEDFHANSQKTTVPMMHSHKLKGGRYAAFNADGSLFVTPEHRSQGATIGAIYPGQGGFQIAELPYKGGTLAMVLVVPRDVDGLTAIEKELTAARLRAWLGKLDERVMSVSLPKFGIESSYEMSDTLRELGMRQAMNPDDADFSGMSADGSRGLAISRVLHKAFVKVTEQGTEAAAATAAVLREPGRVLSVFIPAVRADRPFLFAIVDRGTGTILFLGRLVDPADAALPEGSP
jgi:serpin B